MPNVIASNVPFVFAIMWLNIAVCMRTKQKCRDFIFPAPERKISIFLSIFKDSWNVKKAYITAINEAIKGKDSSVIDKDL